MKNFFHTHKALCIIVAVALIATGTIVAINNLNFDKTDIVSSTTSGTSNLQNSESNTTTTQPAEQKQTGKITTETSDNMLMCFVGSEKALQNWAHTSSRIEFERSYPDTFIFTETPYHIAADGKYALDLSAKSDKSVIGYLTKEGSEIVAHIAGKDGVIMANPNSSYLFGWIVDETNLKEINFNGNFNTVTMQSAAFMFNNSSKLEKLDVGCFDTSNVINMSRMFGGCSSLTNLDLSNFNTSNVEKTTSMFSGCDSLTSLDLSNFDTSKVVDMSWMFSYCNQLTNIDITNFNTSNVIDMSGMFNACLNLTSLDLSNFNTSKVTDMHSMFTSNYKLVDVNVSSFDTSTTKRFDYMFEDCTALKTIDISNFTFTDDCDAYDMFENNQNVTIKYKGETYNYETFDNYLKSIGAIG